MAMLLLVVVIGRALQSYLQSLILVVMLGAELLYEGIRRPIRFPMVWRLQVATISVLICCLIISLFQVNVQSTASPRVLDALGIIAILGNAVLCVLFLLYIVFGYKDDTLKWFQWSKRHISRSFGSQGSIKQLVASVSGLSSRSGLHRKQSDGPMLQLHTGAMSTDPDEDNAAPTSSNRARFTRCQTR